jgi:hypothetical protein
MKYEYVIYMESLYGVEEMPPINSRKWIILV